MGGQATPPQAGEQADRQDFPSPQVGAPTLGVRCVGGQTMSVSLCRSRIDEK